MCSSDLFSHPPTPEVLDDVEDDKVMGIVVSRQMPGDVPAHASEAETSDPHAGTPG